MYISDVQGGGARRRCQDVEDLILRGGKFHNAVVSVGRRYGTRSNEQDFSVSEVLIHTL